MAMTGKLFIFSDEDSQHNSTELIAFVTALMYLGETFKLNDDVLGYTYRDIAYIFTPQFKEALLAADMSPDDLLRNVFGEEIVEDKDRVFTDVHLEDRATETLVYIIMLLTDAIGENVAFHYFIMDSINVDEKFKEEIITPENFIEKVTYVSNLLKKFLDDIPFDFKISNEEGDE